MRENVFRNKKSIFVLDSNGTSKDKITIKNVYKYPFRYFGVIKKPNKNWAIISNVSPKGNLMNAVFTYAESKNLKSLMDTFLYLIDKYKIIDEMAWVCVKKIPNPERNGILGKIRNWIHVTYYEEMEV